MQKRNLLHGIELLNKNKENLIMRKIYRISVFNRVMNRRELMWERYTSKKKAQEFTDKINKLDTDGIIQARVFIEAH
ncbi:MAG: hypothetical protein J6R59_10660 [Paludibacteraceae bacterium]|nr:hypothetical protein [Paludibacteraceae bacterium]